MTLAMAPQSGQAPPSVADGLSMAWREVGSAEGEPAFPPSSSLRSPREIFDPRPRYNLPLPPPKVTILPPPPPPARPATDWLSILSAIGPTITIGSVGILSAMVFSGGNYRSLALILPTLALTSVISIVQLRRARRAYTAAIHTRAERYSAYLEVPTDETPPANLDEERAGAALKRAAAQQLAALRDAHPSPQLCLRRALTRKRLWERSPSDWDYLALRVGIGPVDASFHIDLQSADPLATTDELYAKADALRKRCEQISEAPVTVALDQHSVVAFVGDGDGRENLARVALVQLGAHHSPREIRLMAIFPSADENRKEPDRKWAWLRFLPHTWSDDRAQRYLATSGEDAALLFEELAREVTRRQESRGDQAMQRIVLLVADRDVFMTAEGDRWNRLRQSLLRQGRELRIHLLWVDDFSGIPSQSSLVIEAPSDGWASLRGGKPTVDHAFRPDSVRPTEAMEFARALAPLSSPSLSDVHGLPDQVLLSQTLQTAFNAGSIESFDAADAWYSLSPRPWKRIDVPIGAAGGGALVYLDFLANPHGIVGGMTGSGKSRSVASWLALLAASYAPDEVTFLILDFKGGDMEVGISQLPHVLGTYTNLQPDLLFRVEKALRREKDRREDLLPKGGDKRHDTYVEAYRSDKGEKLKPLPHLFVVVDEYLELKTKAPSLAKELNSIAMLGRSLGIHLLLATQNPAQAVDQIITTNVLIRVSFQLSSEADSQSLLKAPDAAYIRNKGRGLLKVGSEDIVPFQSVYGYGPHKGSRAVAADEHLVYEVALNGRMSVPLSLENPRSASEGTEVEAFSSRVCSLAKQMALLGDDNKPRLVHPPWLPELASPLLLVNERDRAQSPPPWSAIAPRRERDFEALVGRLDDPEYQEQPPLRVDLDSGNWLLYGPQDSGKSTLLTTLLVDLCDRRSPEQLQVYIVTDSPDLELLAKLPHVGQVMRPNDLPMVFGLLTHARRLMESRDAATTTETKDAEPRVLFIFDNLQDLANAAVQAIRLGAFAPKGYEAPYTIQNLLSRGRSRGLFTVCATREFTGISPDFQNLLTRRLAFNLGTVGDYRGVLSFPSQTTFDHLPHGSGRGLVRFLPGYVEGTMKRPAERPLEFLGALAVPKRDDLPATIAQICNRWDAAISAPPIAPVVVPSVTTGPSTTQASTSVSPPQSVPEVKLDDLLSSRASSTNAPVRTGGAPIALDLDTRHAVGLDLDTCRDVLVVGHPGSGKTTFLQSFLLSLAEIHSRHELRIYVIAIGEDGSSYDGLRDLPHTVTVISEADRGPQEVPRIFGEILAERELRETAKAAQSLAMDADSAGGSSQHIVLCWDDYVEPAEWPSESHKTHTRLKSLLDRDDALGIHVVLACWLKRTKESDSPVLQALRRRDEVSLVLGNDAHELGYFDLPPERFIEQSPLRSLSGVGRYGRPGQWRTVRAANWRVDGSTSLEERVRRIKDQSAAR